MTKNITDDFPYLIPFVNIEKGEIRIILQLFIKTLGRKEAENSGVEEKYRSFYESSIKFADDRTKSSEYVSSRTYTIEELKEFYVLCGRFPIKKKINIESLSLHELSKEL